MLALINELFVQLAEAEFLASLAEDRRRVLHVCAVRALLLEVERSL